MDSNRLSPPPELDAFVDGVLIFKRKRSHVLPITAVKNPDRFGAEAASSASGVDCGVTGADDHHLSADLEVVAGLVARDEVQCVDDRRVVFARDTQFAHRAKADA